MDAYYAVRTNWLDCPVEDDPRLMCLASDVRRLEADHAQLVALVKALPKVEGIGIFHTNSTWGVVADDPNYCATFGSLDEAEAYAALLQARKEMGG